LEIRLHRKPASHLPYLIHDFQAATSIALVVVAVELTVISWIRKRYMDTPLPSANVPSRPGGVLVFLAGWLIGSGLNTVAQGGPKSDLRAAWERL
jgi:uncharacterized membrane protein (DUF485 family)